MLIRSCCGFHLCSCWFECGAPYDSSFLHHHRVTTLFVTKRLWYYQNVTMCSTILSWSIYKASVIQDKDGPMPFSLSSFISQLQNASFPAVSFAGAGALRGVSVASYFVEFDGSLQWRSHQAALHTPPPTIRETLTITITTL